MLDALRIGYEVEPEPLKVGDWIVVEDCPCERIIGKVQMLTDIEKYPTFIRFRYEDWWSIKKETKLRHATPEEIKAEMERRVWAKFGREVGQFKIGDAYEYTDGNWGVVLSEGIAQSAKRFYDEGRIVGLLPAESFVSFEEIVRFGDGDTNA